jgi:purine-cytosine permease-like protein
MGTLRFAGRRIPLPKHPILRAMLGVALLLGGVLGFLPVLGYWMIPLGLGVLATDYRPARRLYRRMTVSFGNLLHRRWPAAATKAGYGPPRSHRNGAAAVKRPDR